MTESYDFYGILKLIINSNRRDYLNYFNNEYEEICKFRDNIQFDVQGTTTIKLSIVDNLPDTKLSIGIHKKVKFKNLFNVEYLICGIETDNVEIYFKGNIVDRLYLKSISVFTQCELLEPVMYAKFLEKGFILMHAAGVATESSAAIFAAKGGSGKTTLCTRLCSLGYFFLGDDLLLVNPKEKAVCPYPRPLHLFAYNINTVPKSGVKYIVMLKIYIKNIIRIILQSIARQEVLISTRVKVQDIYPDIKMGFPVKYKKLYFLKSGGPSINQLIINDGNIENIADEIITSFDLNKSLHKLLDGNMLLYLQAIKEVEKSLMRDFLSTVDCITYIDTRKQTTEDIISHVNK